MTQKQLSMKVTLMYLNQSIVQLYETDKNFQEKVQASLLIQSLTIILVFQKIFFSWKQLYQITKKKRTD